LLFTLRRVDQQDLIREVGSDLSTKRKPPSSAKVLTGEDLGEMFGIELARTTPTGRAAASPGPTEPSAPARSAAAFKEATVTRPSSLKPPAAKSRARKNRLSPAKQRAVSEGMRRYWAARRAALKKRKA
jgi:hypothetical protein